MSNVELEGSTSTIPTPKVFISYSWTSDAHVAWVEGLATRLQSEGVEVIFDRWDLKRGHDKYAFMEKMVTDPDVKKVLAICDSKYAAKADGREGGVGTESQIISPQVYAKAQQEKFIPVVRERDNAGEAFLPTFFKQTIYLDFSDDARFEERFDELLRDIFDAPVKKRPPLGKPPAHLFIPNPVHVKTAGAFLRLKNAVENQRPFVNALFEQYLDLFIESLEDFRIKLTNENRATFDDVVVKSIEQFRAYRDNIIECILFMLKFAPGQETERSIIAFLEKLIPFQQRPDHVNSWSEVDFDNYRFFAYELFLYLIAACLRTRQYGSAATFIECEYHVPKSLGGGDFYVSSATGCNEYIATLDDIRNKRLKLNLISVTAGTIQERAPSGPISFREVVQADFLLHIRRFFPARGAFDHWYPRCLPYAERSGSMELFTKATSDRGFEPLKTLLRIPDKNALMDGLEQLLAARPLDMGHRISYSIPAILNLPELNRVTGREVGK